MGTDVVQVFYGVRVVPGLARRTLNALLGKSQDSALQRASHAGLSVLASDDGRAAYVGSSIGSVGLTADWHVEWPIERLAQVHEEVTARLQAALIAGQPGLHLQLARAPRSTGAVR